MSCIIELVLGLRKDRLANGYARLTSIQNSDNGATTIIFWIFLYKEGSLSLLFRKQTMNWVFLDWGLQLLRHDFK